jgi:hypothetical protein
LHKKSKKLKKHKKDLPIRLPLPQFTNYLYCQLP